MWLPLVLACAPKAPMTLPEPPTAAATRRSVSAGGDPVLERILLQAREDPLAMPRLASLCDGVGARLAGSAALDRAVEWSVRLLEEDGHARVWTEPVAVPHWERGVERLRMVAPYSRDLAVLGLGGTVGTDGLEAPVAVVRSFDDLGPRVAGHIVLYDVPMAESAPAIGSYGPVAEYRSNGASRAAAHGAVGSLVRSITTRSLYTPHTGGMRYEDGVARIPAAAVTTEDAAMLARLVETGVPVRLRLDLGARTFDDALGHNVLAEIPGAGLPEEVVVLGAHLDSWDVGQGAHDDGVGVVQVIEAMRIIASLGTAPRRTIRAVLFTNEENGLRGGEEYALAHRGERHVVAVETDLGGGGPRGWAASGAEADLAWFAAAAAPLGLPVETGGGGADISPLGKAGVLVAGLLPDDSHYFDVHHTHADTVDKVDPVAMRESLAALAALTWSLANAEPP